MSSTTEYLVHTPAAEMIKQLCVMCGDVDEDGNIDRNNDEAWEELVVDLISNTDCPSPAALHALSDIISDLASRVAEDGPDIERLRLECAQFGDGWLAGLLQMTPRTFRKHLRDGTFHPDQVLRLRIAIRDALVIPNV